MTEGVAGGSASFSSIITSAIRDAERFCFFASARRRLAVGSRIMTFMARPWPTMDYIDKN